MSTHPTPASRRPGRPSPWSPLLVLGGSALAATLLIQLGTQLAAAADPVDALAARASRSTPEAPPPDAAAVAVVAQAR
ncbi:hypothetical protein KAK06_13035 [Ideonella sp. 4Y11]|uniref:Uncharacterized protein n=1 Tax=Ideonella aquatica TaxID=2824119 RepID=A0A940YGU8_9BURK|nr:hypothetical protein [Ideonella aquatica]MBQ0959870.1 hypothetical protein [Ideonella aquatica]